jgi:Fe-S-cluster containining protein
MKYQKTSDFIKNETVMATWEETSPGGGVTIMTGVNLKRKQDETEADDGTHIKCRFLDDEGSCGIHPTRPGVCYLYPFSTWLQNEKGVARVHATFQFTGDCPGFYLDDSMDSMNEVLQEYSEIIYDYNFKSSGTMRDGLGSISLG